MDLILDVAQATGGNGREESDGVVGVNENDLAHRGDGLESGPGGEEGAADGWERTSAWVAELIVLNPVEFDVIGVEQGKDGIPELEVGPNEDCRM
jgi:hypothetical protein